MQNNNNKDSIFFIHLQNIKKLLNFFRVIIITFRQITIDNNFVNFADSRIYDNFIVHRH